VDHRSVLPQRHQADFLADDRLTTAEVAVRCCSFGYCGAGKQAVIPRFLGAKLSRPD
jgi:hypothetical protein